jgi:5-methylcytosine-specific restriction endonuclease McrA
MTEEWSFDMNESKPCTKCGEAKAFAEFSKNRNTKDGLQQHCKECNRAYQRANRERISARDKARRLVDGDKMRAQSRANWAKHKDKRIAYMRNRYQERREEYQAYNRARYPEIAERKRANAKAWRKANPERSKQQLDKWRAENLDKHNENARKRRARLRNAKTRTVTAKDLQRLLSAPCAYCGAKENITIDHVVPLARGGDHTIGNFLPACKTCNSRKRDSFIMEWRKRESPRR